MLSLARGTQLGSRIDLRDAFLAMSDLLNQLQATLEKMPTHAWYASSTGGLTYLNSRSADYVALPIEHPLRLGIDTGAPWDSHLVFLHPDDHANTRRIWGNCLRTGCGGEVEFRGRGHDGIYRWFLSRAEPLRADDGTILLWVGVNLEIDDRKRAEFYLAEAQRLGHTGSWAFNERGFIHWSSELFAVHGLPPGKPPGIAEYLAAVHPEDRAFLAEQLHDIAANPREFDVTNRIVRPDGAIRWVRCVGVPATNGAGLLGTGMDVTEQHELTDALRKSESQLRQMLDFAPQLVSVVGPAGEHIHINRIALAYLGTTLEKWQRTGLADEVHPDDLERVARSTAEAQARGTAYELELRIRRHDGIYRWFLARFNPMRDDSGQVVRWYHACTDIEDRIRAEERLRQENVTLREDIDQASMFEEIIGTSPALQPVLTRVAKVARSQSTVMVTGETGTGKELVARAIHRRSSRGNRAFVGVNCAAVPRELVASELFGHEQGAFTGATQRRLGRFELANGGTLFLDEVGELSMEIQVALLRVLQERELERVGGSTPIRVDVRVVAATNRDLDAAIRAGAFRADLFYRLNVFPIVVPPLRERADDIPLLVEYFVDRYARQAGKRMRRISKRTLEHLQAYPWPGNVRELQNVIERSVIVCETEEFVVDESWLSVGPVVANGGALPHTVAAHERAVIEEALRATGGRVFGPSGAAFRLGIPRSTLESKIRALGINKNRFRA
jgi:formate hydrogenlyase transcriptional activator